MLRGKPYRAAFRFGLPLHTQHQQQESPYLRLAFVSRFVSSAVAIITDGGVRSHKERRLGVWLQQQPEPKGASWIRLTVTVFHCRLSSGNRKMLFLPVMHDSICTIHLLLHAPSVRIPLNKSHIQTVRAFFCPAPCLTRRVRATISVLLHPNTG